MKLQFLSLIHKATRQIGLRLETPCAELGLDPGEGHLISYLQSYGPCPIAELHRVLGYKPSTLTSVLDRLSAQGLLRRLPHPRDRRSFLIELTREGRSVAAAIQRMLEALEARIRSRVGRAEIAGFRAVMSAIDQVTGVEVRARESARETPKEKK